MNRTWALLEGAKKYAMAGITSGWRSPEEVARVAAICGACSEKRGFVSIFGPTVAFCGEPVWSKERSNPKTCGCLLFRQHESPTSISINGKPYEPIAKLLVNGERCPLEKF